MKRATNEPASLEGPRLKVDRAREHLDVLDAFAREYVDESGALHFYGERQGSELVAKVLVKSPPPFRLALICGDAVHNLRSALDHLVLQLGIADSGMVSDKSEWPVVTDAAKWASDAGRKLALLSQPHRDQIRQLQPFVDSSDNSPGVMLASLDWLDNRDKHRILIPVAAAAVKDRITLSPGSNRVQLSTPHDEPSVLEGDVELFRLAVSRVPGGPLNVRSTTHVVMSFGTQGGPTTKNLRDLADLVAGNIASFELDVTPASTG